MKMYILCMLIFLVMSIATRAQECNTPLLRDVVSIDSDKTDTLLSDLGDTSALVTGLPLLDSVDPLTIRTTGDTFTAPHFIIIPKDSFSPHYWITAVEIQQGPAGRFCTSTAVIRDIVFEVKEATGYTAVSTTFNAGIQTRNSAPYYNWQRFGANKADGQTLRFNFNPIGGDGLRFEVLNIDPLTSSITTEACLRVELYGCEKTTNTPPAIYTSPLYQYNLVEPSADSHTDPSYTGIRSGGYLSGGEGILTDGVVGGDAVNAPIEWVGWEKARTPQIEIIMLLINPYQYKRINVLYWLDSANGMGAPANIILLDHDANTLEFTPEDISISDNVKSKSFIRETTVLTSYVKILLEYETGVDTILLTEIELVTVEGVNVLTGMNASITTSPTLPPTTTTPIPTTTQTTTTTTTTPPTTTTPTQTTTTETTTSSSITTPAVTTPTPTTTQTTTPYISTTITEDPSIIIQATSESVTDTQTTYVTGSAAPDGGLKKELIIGLIFVIITIIIIVLIVIILVSIFYYMKSKGKGVGDLNCAGAGGWFRKDVESHRGSIKSKLQKYSLMKGRGTAPIYEPVPEKLEISPPVQKYEPLEEMFSDKDSFTDAYEDLNIYAPVSAISSIYATVNKAKKDKIYEEPQLDLSLPSTPLDADQTGGNGLQPLSSIYEVPALLSKEEGPIELTWQDVEERDKLGNGQFGEVCLASLINYSARGLGIGASEKKGVEIALKKLPANSTQQTKDNFSNEIKFMARLNHPNVIKLIGVCLNDLALGRFIAMEYMINGDLAQFLKESDYVDSIGANLRIQEVNQDCMVYMGQQIASGMEYLSDRNYIHRDLSARNCLVGSNYTVKVADFGMSQNLYSSEYFKITGRATLPIRWMSNESFYGKFTIKTDVWAFGVTLWEIFAKCEKKPYEGLSDHELIQDVLANKLNRTRLNRPDYSPDEGWELITRCTQMDPDNRPTFDLIRGELEDMCKFQIEEINI